MLNSRRLEGLSLCDMNVKTICKYAANCIVFAASLSESHNQQ